MDHSVTLCGFAHGHNFFGVSKQHGQPLKAFLCLWKYKSSEEAQRGTVGDQNKHPSAWTSVKFRQRKWGVGWLHLKAIKPNKSFSKVFNWTEQIKIG